MVVETTILLLSCSTRKKQSKSKYRVSFIRAIENQKSKIKMLFSDKTEALMRQIMRRYPEGRHKSALLPLLHIAQAESDGWLSVPVMDRVAEILSIQPIEVYEVATFYSMFQLKPVGKCLIEVCRTSSCWLRGANDIVAHIEQKLGIKNGETTPDGKFTLRTVECLGSCGTAPMLQIGEKYYEDLTFEKVDQILEENKNRDNHSTYLSKTTFQNHE
ncbi:MAG: NADH-quinone oxidoreductase subunit NuoE [Saprospiraceae bacterium]|uniref:NADH-quinone oxidoreductase subunit NuoE n=1 Tax=Candidatus Opimibacter skivensis TaxID=2982028 RepID=A0A9D7SZC4_9BACT|nr:NADH-quinone oxidoreductase subunit NuoE [Candidatus Opimibacter skivensis]